MSLTLTPAWLRRCERHVPPVNVPAFIARAEHEARATKRKLTDPEELEDILWAAFWGLTVHIHQQACEAAWKARKAELEQAEAKELAAREAAKKDAASKIVADGKSLTMRQRVEWVWSHLNEDELAEGACPDRQTHTMWEAYHGSDETKRQFFERFAVKYLPTQSDVDKDAKKGQKSDKIVEELDRVLEEHVAGGK